MTINAGELTRRVMFRRAVIASDGSGGQLKTWEPIGTVWAKAISQNGREAVLSGTLQGVSAWQITIRYRPDITTADQCVLDGRELNIRSAEDPDGRRERTVIFADSAAVQG